MGGDTAAFTTLNAAYQTLRDPVKRLAHLLALEFPSATGATNASEDLPELFLRVGSVMQRLTRFMAREKAISGHMAHAFAAEERIGLAEEVRTVLCAVQEEHRKRLLALRELDEQWNSDSTELATRLCAVHAALAFLAKWADELRERSLRLLESGSCGPTPEVA